MEKDKLFYIDGKYLIEQAKKDYPKKSKSGYKVILVNKDFFFKGTMIQDFAPEIFIPRFKRLNVFLGDELSAEPTVMQKRFKYVGMWGKFLIYKEEK